MRNDSMNEIFSKQHYRRTFFIVVALVLLIALVTRFFVLPYYQPTQTISGAVLAGLLLDNLVVSLFIAVFLGGFVFWLTPEIVKRSTIEVIEPKQINGLLKSAAGGTHSWVYKGACGRYTRATTLPKLAETARMNGISREITICILNPKNEALCNAYATYRRSLKSCTSGKVWTRERVQEEVLATAVTALRYQFVEPLLHIRVFFVNHFSAFRLDISDEYAIVTKEDKDATALRADAGTYFYDSYKDDVRLTERQSNKMVCSIKLDFSDSLVDEKKLREAVKSADLFDGAKLQQLDLKMLLANINKPSDPY